MPQLRLMEKKQLLRREDFDEAIDSIAGIVLTHLSGGGALFERPDGAAQDRRRGV
jgi:hypothetical protein